MTRSRRLSLSGSLVVFVGMLLVSCTNDHRPGPTEAAIAQNVPLTGAAAHEYFERQLLEALTHPGASDSWIIGDDPIPRTIDEVIAAFEGKKQAVSSPRRYSPLGPVFDEETETFNGYTISRTVLATVTDAAASVYYKTKVVGDSSPNTLSQRTVGFNSCNGAHTSFLKDFPSVTSHSILENTYPIAVCAIGQNDTLSGTGIFTESIGGVPDGRNITSTNSHFIRGAGMTVVITIPDSIAATGLASFGTLQNSSNCGDLAQWTTSNANVVSVDGGLYAAHAAGTAILTASCYGASGSKAVSVPPQEEDDTEPSPCGNQLIYDPSTCDATGGGESGGGSSDPNTDPCLYLVTVSESKDGGVTWVIRSRTIINVC